MFGVSSTVVASLLGLMARSISVIASGGVTSMSGVYSISSCSWVCCGSWFPLFSSPVISASPMIRTLWSVQIKCSGSPFARSFNPDMTVSGIGIESHLLLVIFFCRLKAHKLE